MTAMFSLRTASIVWGMALLTSGCAIVPRVDYHTLSDGTRRDRWVLFRLTESVIAVGAPGRAVVDAAGKTIGPGQPLSLGMENIRCDAEGCAAPLAAAVAPADYEPSLYALDPRSRNLVETTLTATYNHESLRLKVLTVEAKDHRLEAINTIGAIATGISKETATRSSIDRTETLGAGAKPAQATLHVPFVIDLAEARCQSEAAAGCVSAVVQDPADPTAKGGPHDVPRNPDWTYALRFIDNPRATGLVSRADMPTVHGAMVASICRPAVLQLKPKAFDVTPPLSFRIVVADPDWLKTAPFPTKGALTFQGLCDLDVQAEPVTTVGMDVLATAFFNNIEAVRAAQKR